MGLFNATAFLKGAAQEGLNMFNKAEAIGEEGIENLKAAREEVNEEIKTMKDTYNKAIQIGDNVGGGAFAKYLFQAEGLNNLASYADLPLSDREEQLRLAKSNFEALSEEDKARFSDGDFSETVKADYDKEVEALKVNSGLVNTNNLGVATANTLGGKVQQMVDRQFEPRRQAIMDTVSGGELKESKPIEGGFEAIPSLKDGQQVNFQKAPIELFDEVLKVNEAYDKYVSETYFTGTYDTFSDENYYRDIGNLIGLPSTTLAERNNIDNFLEKVAEQIENEYDIAQTAQGVGFEMLKADYVNRRYGKVFRYTGPLDLYDPRQE